MKQVRRIRQLVASHKLLDAWVRVAVKRHDIVGLTLVVEDFPNAACSERIHKLARYTKPQNRVLRRGVDQHRLIGKAQRPRVGVAPQLQISGGRRECAGRVRVQAEEGIGGLRGKPMIEIRHLYAVVVALSQTTEASRIISTTEDQRLLARLARCLGDETLRLTLRGREVLNKVLNEVDAARAAVVVVVLIAEKAGAL